VSLRPLKNPAVHLIVGLIAIGAAFLIAGPLGAAGFSLGLFGSTFNLGVWHLILGLMAGAGRADAKPGFGTFLVILAFLVKLPFYVALAFVAHRLGGPAVPCFLLGVGLVYFALVGWALASS